MKHVWIRTFADGPRLGLLLAAAICLLRIGSLSWMSVLLTVAGSIAAGIIMEFTFYLVRHLRGNDSDPGEYKDGSK